MENKDFDLLEIVSSAVKDMSEEELLQIEKARRLDIEEKVYFDIIRKKTAVLISKRSCGASSMNQNNNIVQKMKIFGEKVGIAFQIKDDLFDYTQSSLIGKPTGIDIREQKMTLPLIFTLNKVDNKIKNKIINIIKNHNKNQKKVEEIIDLVIKNGGVDYAKKSMIMYQKQALEILLDFPKNNYRDSLEKLVNYVIDRKK